MSETASLSVTVRVVEFDLSVDAPRDRAWAALVHELNAWFPAEFRAAGAESEVLLEARVGGRFYERNRLGDGSGVLWYTVIALDPPQSIDFAGHLTPAFGGPAVSMLHLEMESEGAATRIRLRDTLMGPVSDESFTLIAGGWRQLLTGGLKAHVEAVAG